jgi:hypothetical protein
MNVPPETPPEQLRSGPTEHVLPKVQRHLPKVQRHLPRPRRTRHADGVSGRNRHHGAREETGGYSAPMLNMFATYTALEGLARSLIDTSPR